MKKLLSPQAKRSWPWGDSAGPVLILAFGVIREEILTGNLELRDEIREAVNEAVASLEGSWLSLCTRLRHPPVADDPVVLAAIRVLGAWLQKDGDPKFSDDLAKLYPMFIWLYGLSYDIHKTEGNGYRLDFRMSVLEAMMDVRGEGEDGGASFLEANGWALLMDALIDVSSKVMNPECGTDMSNEIQHGDHIMGVLSTLVDTWEGSMEDSNMGLFHSYRNWHAPDTKPDEKAFAFQMRCVRFAISVFAYLDISKKDGWRSVSRHIYGALRESTTLSWMTLQQVEEAKALMVEIELADHRGDYSLTSGKQSAAKE